MLRVLVSFHSTLLVSTFLCNPKFLFCRNYEDDSFIGLLRFFIEKISSSVGTYKEKYGFENLRFVYGFLSGLTLFTEHTLKTAHLLFIFLFFLKTFPTIFTLFQQIKIKTQKETESAELTNFTHYIFFLLSREWYFFLLEEGKR